MLNEDKILRFQKLAMSNCLRLHFDSLILFKQKSFPSAFVLSILALEEFGKVFIVDELIYHYRVGELPGVGLNDFAKMIHSHKDKQVWCLGHFYAFNDKHRKELGAATTGKFEKQKQNALYVGLQNKTFKGKIISPFDIKRDKAKKKILLVNEILHNMTDFKLKQGEYFDGEYVDKLITRSLLKKLEKIKLLI